MEWHSFDWERFALLAQAAREPQIDSAYVIGVLSRVFHILFAIILGGGLFYLRTVLAPAGPDACYAQRRGVWARWVGIATLLLVASGLYNYLAIVRAAKAAGAPMPSTYHMLFGVKFLLALAVFFIAAILAGKTTAADRFRTHMGRWLNVAWLAVMTIVILAALMRTYH